MKFATAYSKRQRHTVTFPENGLTKQSFKDECDINNIMARWAAGDPTVFNQQAQEYGYVPNTDFLESQLIVLRAREQFAALPAKLRKKFQNDPSQFLQYVEDPGNRTEMADLGLLTPEAVEALRAEAEAPQASGNPPAEPPAPAAPSPSETPT